MALLTTRSLTLGYDGNPVVSDLSLVLAEGKITTLVGPNGCGKTTVLRALCRLLRPRGGAAYLDGQAIHRLPTRDVARTLGLLSQHSEVPAGLTVAELVRRARYPRLGPWEPLGPSDERAVDRALGICGLSDLGGRPVDELSGGQRQRAWIALAVAQETPVLLLDEPTTFLDPRHQGEVLDLVVQLNRNEGRTLVLVLHDLEHASRVSDTIVAFEGGKIRAEGPPGKVLTPELLRSLYGVDFEVGADPRTGRPVPRPLSRLTRKDFPPGGASRIEARGLSAGYGTKGAFGPLDLDLGPGGLTVLLGPNGSGKSTLLKTLAGLHRPSAGSVRINGVDPGDLRPRAASRLRAFLTQEPLTPPGFSVGELVALGRFGSGMFWEPPRSPDDVAVRRALDAVGLGTWTQRSASDLSGGQRQRAWIAQALAQEAPVLFLDEPTSFLDPGHQIEVMDALWTLTRGPGVTVVAILHDPRLAGAYADRILESDAMSYQDIK